ncbi:hypothetical protein [Tardiphaga sp. 841_E9_N1_2]|uniref:hypothetical protein n=1 Tax=Tardiphaga sp. 841_E9_N1_2 TaxID=3240762 RepID=UPI003F21DF72
MVATTLADGIRFNATSTGTGDFVSSGAVSGYRNASGVLVNGATYRYRAENASLSEYERGYGVWNSGTSTLARSTIDYSSTGSKVAFSSVPQVGITPGPDDLMTPTLMRSYLAGLTLSTAGSSASFGIAAGVATDSTNVDMLALTSAYTKTNTIWAIGSGNGGMDTGTASANTWYHVFLIKRPDTGVADILVSASATSPTLPTNYTMFRRVGSIRTDGSSNWLLFSQFGDEFLWGVGSLTNDVNDNTLGTTPKLYTLRVPPGVKVTARIRSNGVSSSFLIASPDEGTIAFNTPTTNQTSNSSSGVTTNTLDVRTNTSAQVQAVAQGASTSIFITAYGWIDRRGRDS